MGKKYNFNFEMIDRNIINHPISKKHHKKHKKHKKKKAVRHVFEGEIDVVSDITVNLAPSKIILTPPSTCSSSVSSTGGSAKTQNKKKKNVKGKDSGTSSDEERWLDAIESGKLEEVDDELKKIKDPRLMTARQRAMYERSTDKDLNPANEMLMSLPTGYKEKVMTAEAIQKAQLKSQKRKQLADEKREKDKKKTMERLLKKQDSTKIGKQVKSKLIKTTQHPVITYKNSLNNSTITFPINIDFPLLPQSSKDPPKIKLCSVPGCKNIKSYNCSKTNMPLCSFACYQKHISSVSL